MKIERRESKMVFLTQSEEFAFQFLKWVCDFIIMYKITIHNWCDNNCHKTYDFSIAITDWKWILLTIFRHF